MRNLFALVALIAVVGVNNSAHAGLFGKGGHCGSGGGHHRAVVTREYCPTAWAPPPSCGPSYSSFPGSSYPGSRIPSGQIIETREIIGAPMGMGSSYSRPFIDGEIIDSGAGFTAPRQGTGFQAPRQGTGFQGPRQGSGFQGPRQDGSPF